MLGMLSVTDFFSESLCRLKDAVGSPSFQCRSVKKSGAGLSACFGMYFAQNEEPCGFPRIMTLRVNH